MTPYELFGEAPPIWAIAAWLGTDYDRTPPDQKAPRGVQSGRDVAALQAAYERGEGPEPEARPVALGELPAWMLDGALPPAWEGIGADPPG